MLLLFIIVTLIVACIFLLYYVYNLSKPSPGNCDYLKASDPSIKWGNGCSSIEEVSLDTSLTTPSSPLFLASFTNSPSLGEPWGANIWYKYVYVDGKTGNYSNPSPWTKSAISAGSNSLPTATGSTFIKYTGKDSCQSNLPTLSVKSLDYALETSNMYANVHRYITTLSDTTPPSNDTPGKVVGMLLPDTNGGGYTFIDISESPCKEVMCNNVKGC